MLFRADAFESLTRKPWDEQRARRGIAEIVTDAEETFDAVSLWPAEKWDAWGSPTGEELWLDRARRFAVHVLEQVERRREERGVGRYTLWTGDLGVAVFAADCLDARAAYPILETWD